MKKILGICLMLFAVSAFAATITKSHFDGGSNLNAGHKKGSAGTLADLIMGLQDADTAIQGVNATQTADIALKQNAAGLVAIACAAGAGGGATAALTCTGLLTTDTILSVSQKTPGANSLPLLGWSTVAANSLTVAWSADPGAGAVVVIGVKR